MSGAANFGIYPAGSVICLQSQLPDLARRSSIALAKGAIEVGQISEPDIERDRTDGAIRKPGIA
jgi:hypothetical protein